MPTTLTITDNADGTGATATIAGGSVGAAHTVDVYQFAGVTGGLSLIGSFSRIGDGDIPLAVEAGGYFAVLSSDGALVTVAYFSATDAELCLWDEILDAVVAKIQSLPLAGIDAANIRRGKLPIKYADIGTVGVLVCPFKETITLAGNRKDQIGYACLVTCFKASNGDNTTALGEELKWRDQIATAFKLKPGYNPLASVAEVFNVNIEPGSVVLPEAFLQANYDAGSLVLRVFVTQDR